MRLMASTYSKNETSKDGLMDVFSLYSNCVFVLNVEFTATSPKSNGPPPLAAGRNGAAKPVRFCSPVVMKSLKEKLMKSGVSRIGRYWMTPSLVLEVDFSSESQLKKFVSILAQGEIMNQFTDNVKPSGNAHSSSSPSSVPLQMGLFFIWPDHEQDEVVMEPVTSDNVQQCVAMWKKRVKFNMGALLNWYKETKQSCASGVASLPQLREELKTVRAWVWLGLFLRIPLADLQKIQQERGHEGVKACLTTMLEQWTDKKKDPPMWCEVVDALHLAGQTALAKHIAKKYKLPASSQQTDQPDHIDITGKAKQQLKLLSKQQHQLQELEEEIARKTAEKKLLDETGTRIFHQLERKKAQCRKLKTEKREREEEMKVVEKEILAEQASKLEQEMVMNDRQLDMMMSKDKHATLISIAECSQLIDAIQTKITSKQDKLVSLRATVGKLEQELSEYSKQTEIQSELHNHHEKAANVSRHLHRQREKYAQLRGKHALAEEALNLIILRKEDEKESVTPSDSGSEVTPVRKNDVTEFSDHLHIVIRPPAEVTNKDRKVSAINDPSPSPPPPSSLRHDQLRRGSTPCVPYMSRTLPRSRHHSTSSSTFSSITSNLIQTRKHSESGGSQKIKVHLDDSIMDGVLESVADPSRCVVTSTSSTPVQLDEDISYTVTLRDQYNRPCKHRQIVTAEGKSHIKGVITPARVTHLSYSQCKINFRPATRGHHEVAIRVNSRLIGGESLKLYVATPLARIPKPRAQKIVNGMGRPWGVATDHDHRIIVTHPQLHKVSVFSSSWQQQFSIGSRLGDKQSQFDTPRGVATDSHGYIYIADSCNNRVQKFDKNGKFVRSSTNHHEQAKFSIQLPTGIAVSNHGEVYVCDGQAHCILVFDTDLTPLRTLGSKRGEGKLHHPTGVAVDDSRGVVYIADQGNHRICMMSRQGDFITSFTCGKGGDTWFPTGVAIDTLSSLVYVTDCKHKCVQMFSREGTHVHSFGQIGTQSGEFSSIGGVAVDMNGFLLVCDDINNRIQVF